MSVVTDLQARIKSGAVKAAGSQQYGPKVGSGEFKCLITGATMGKGQGGGNRGQVELKVVAGGTPAEIGGSFNIYTQLKNTEYSEEQIQLWSSLAGEAGANIDKIFEDATDIEEIMTNTMTLLARTIKRGDLLVTVNRKFQKNSDKYFDNKVEFESYTPKVEAEAPTASAEAAPTGTAKPKKQW